MQTFPEFQIDDIKIQDVILKRNFAILTNFYGGQVFWFLSF